MKLESNSGIKKLYRRISVAAALILTVSASLLFLNKNANKPKVSQLLKHQNTAEIKPGENKAILKLADGRSIILGDDANEDIAEFSGLKIRKTSSGHISYTVSPGPGVDIDQVNSISTPRAGQYHITLADGTGVWLNASSSLTFPVSFENKDQRVVTLKGEAYFEVAKSRSKPFLVNVIKNDQAGHTAQIEVLGTHFNVMAYPDETGIKTTLIEGSVKLKNQVKSSILKPGQQGIVRPGEPAIGLKTVDIEEAVAWKNGNFVFHNEDLHSVMRKIARWYDIDVVYSENVDNKLFTGTISRFKSVQEVLAMLELTETVQFKVQGRRVTVMQ